MNAGISERGRPPRSLSIAAALSFVWPGLGQWYLGRRRSAIVFAVPMALAFVAIGIQAVHGIRDFILELFSPSLALTTLILIVLLGAWRLLSMIDAAFGVSAFGVSAGGGGSGAGRTRRSTIATVGVLALVVVTVHAYLGYTAWSFYRAGSDIFVGSGPDGSGPGPGSSSDPGQGFNVPPVATPATSSSRINILLTGIDSSQSRDHALNDTLIVVSIDPTTKQVAMLSFPRDLSQLPLWNGGTYSGKINSLMTYAQAHPSQFPDGGVTSLMKELGFLLGIQMHYYAAVNLDGFVKMIDMVGGVDIVNPRAISDPVYGGWTNGHPVGFQLSAGRHHLDGQNALAYARSRKGTGDNDFTRSRRQQQILLALVHKLTQPSMLPKIPDLVRAAGQTIRTNFPPDRLGEMLDLGSNLDSTAVQQYVLGPPYATYPTTSTGTYELLLDMTRIEKLSISLFGADSAYSPTTQSSPAP